MKAQRKRTPRQYTRTGILAVDPRALFDFFAEPESREVEVIDSVAVIGVCGPLSQHDDWWSDSYPAIVERVQAACDSSASAIVLRIDSPGGDAAGCFDAARKIRALCELAGKPLWAHVEGKACSAAYAIAAAASQVVLGETGIVGSIGVVSTRDDISGMNLARGVRVALIASGARKADGNPNVPISDAELKATQQIVDSLAAVFFDLIAELRGTDAAAIDALEARMFHGQAAVAAGLADSVMSFDEMLAAIASGGHAMATTSYDKARAALEEAAKGTDANAAAAKRALAAMEEQKEPDAEGGDAEPDGDEEKKKKDEEAAAAAAAAASAEGDDEKPAAAASGAAQASADSIALQALAEVHKLRAEGNAEKLKAERKELLASRPDFSPEFLAVLQTADMSTVRKFVKTLPRGPVPKPGAAAAATTAAGVRGQTQGQPHHAPTPEAAASYASAMDSAMGLTTTQLACRREGNALIFGVTEVPLVAPAAATAGGVK
jgi:ClpP class serine protease